MVSEAFKKLPLSSEQIMHPEKYFSYEAPVKVTLPDVNKLLGSGWTRVEDDVNGEWGYYLILDQFLNDAAYSKNAAAGWAGDRFMLYEQPGTNNLVVAQMTVWDSPQDAQEFFEAYSARTLRRYPGAKALNGSESNGQMAEWRTSQGDVLMEVRQSRVLIIEGVPSTADKKGLMTTLWQ